MKNKIMNVIVAFTAALVLVGCGAGNDVNLEMITRLIWITELLFLMKMNRYYF